MTQQGDREAEYNDERRKTEETEDGRWTDRLTD